MDSFFILLFVSPYTTKCSLFSPFFYAFPLCTLKLLFIFLHSLYSGSPLRLQPFKHPSDGKPIFFQIAELHLQPCSRWGQLLVERVHLANWLSIHHHNQHLGTPVSYSVTGNMVEKQTCWPTSSNSQEVPGSYVKKT